MNLRLIAVSATVAAVAFAQPPAGPRMHGAARTAAVQNYLKLTDAQVASLLQLRQSEHAALKPIVEQMDPLRQGLHAQMRTANPDAETVGKLTLSLQSLEQQAAPIRASFQQQAMAVLTPAQKGQLAALESAAALMPAIHEATMLNLLTRPQPPAGQGGMDPEMRPHAGFGPPR